MSDAKGGLKVETLLVHGGQAPEATTGARAVPIYQSASFLFRDTAHAARLFTLEQEGNIYSRIMNPTTDVFERRMALVDGGAGALAVASGQAAITLALLNIAQAGDEIVSFDNLYGGTHNLFRHTFARMGIQVKFIPSGELDALKKAMGPRTKAVYAEAIGNPKLDVTDLHAISEIAHASNVPFVIDNTLTPYLLRPFDHGADIAVYSATKFIGGHGTSIGGIIVDSGRFDWSLGSFPLITGPDPSYHGIDFTARFGNLAYIVKARVNLLRDLGPCMSPFNAFLFLQGLETLHLRMPRHAENALAVARHLEGHPKVAWVNYPGLASSAYHELASRYLPGGAGAIVGFGVRGGYEAGRRFIDALELVSHLANVGDAKTLAIHPASTTHQQLAEEERLAAGVTPDYIRLSVGIEHVGDILDDIDRALDVT